MEKEREEEEEGIERGEEGPAAGEGGGCPTLGRVHDSEGL